jgi:type IV secretory pathway VirB2 component (pilin)
MRIKKMKKYYEKIMILFEILSKIVGDVAALIAVLAIILPGWVM